MRRGGRFYYRRRVPRLITGIVGKSEVWRSLGTDSLTVARRRAWRVAAEIEHQFEVARSGAGLVVDQVVLDGFALTTSVLPTGPESGVSLGALYDAYMSDPTRDWSPTTRMTVCDVGQDDRCAYHLIAPASLIHGRLIWTG